MKKTIIKFVIVVGLFAFSSCKFSGLLDNPNYISLNQTSVDYLLNSVQVEFGTNFFNNASQFGMDNTRMRAMIGGANYNNNYQPVSFDVLWYSFYSTMMPDIRTLIPLAESKNLYVHSGVARVLEAYSLATMVDYFGDIPWSQAFNPTNFNPVADPAAPLYDTALALLDHAIADFAKASAGAPTNDLFYGGNSTQTPGVHWTTAAKTIKLKLYLSRRLVDASAQTEINALIAGGDLIDLANGSEDFQFNFPANSIANPDTRHPFFVNSYLNGAGDYMSNSYMLELYNGKMGVEDPRIRYYFYRQSDVPSTDVNALGCVGVPAPTFWPTTGSASAWCQDPDGYWGRDHLNNDGTGPDNRLRTAYGMYPAGGKFDNNDAVQTTVTDGNQGLGIFPILLASYTSFMEAEAALTLGTTGIPRDLLLDGVSKSVAKTKSFTTAVFSHAPTSTAIAHYDSAITATYDAAPAGPTTGDKLQVVIKEYWIALWGNGVESYNMYRRTGKPDDLQPARNPQPGDFYRSFIYPNAYVTRNSNAKQKPDAQQVFWDTNPADPWID